MSSLKKIVSKINAKIEETTEEFYWDYNSELTPEQMSQIIRGNIHEVEEEIRDLNMDYIFEMEKSSRIKIVEEFYPQIALCFEDDFDSISEVIDEIERLGYELKHVCIDLNLKDLIKNTKAPIAHYDTGYEMDSESWSWTDYQVRLERIKIKKHLNIFNITKYDDHIDQVIMQATYGGQLLIYFKLNINEILNVENVNSISFENYQMGIVDHFNGSGDVMEIAIDEKAVFPFNLDNLFLEQEIKYNWTYSIAGMVSDWADSTDFKLSKEKVGEITASKTGEHIAQEAEYNKTYKEGSCTFGDMDISRHRNAVYINDFPCGNKCKDCGTFWID